MTISAMEIGAVDCVAKPTIEHPNAFATLADKVQAAAGARLSDPSFARQRRSARRRAAPAPTARAPAAALAGRLVAIGASTGGVEALVAILSQFPADCAPTVVTHPSAVALHAQLRAAAGPHLCAARVTRPTHGAPILPGNIYVAPGTHAHLEVSRAESTALRLARRRSGQRPSPFGRRPVPLGRRERRSQGGRRDPDRHGRRRRARPARDAQGRRAHAGPERGDLRRLRHAEGRLADRRRREAGAAAHPSRRKSPRSPLESRD